MKVIKTLSISTLLASSSLLANESLVNSIGLNIGAAHSSYTQKDHQGSITLGNTPDKSFNTYEIYTTLNPIMDMCKKYNMKPYISYTYSSNDDLKHQYLLAGVNKYYNHNSLELYAGALGGYGQIDWKYDPLHSSKNINADANSFIGGLQIGANYLINEKLSIGINSKYLIHDYQTQLKPSDGVYSTIEHDSTSNISFGLEYRF